MEPVREIEIGPREVKGILLRDNEYFKILAADERKKHRVIQKHNDPLVVFENKNDSPVYIRIFNKQVK